MTSRNPRSTPVPTSDLRAMTAAVARVDQNVKTIKEDLLPPLVADTREARDKAREALQKVDAHTADVEHEHTCDEKERQARQDSDIAETREKAAGTSKLIWWLLGILLLVGSSAIGFALMTRAAATEAATRLDDLRNVDDDVARHDVQIKALERAQEADRKTFIKAVRELPTEVSEKVQLSAPPAEQVGNAVDDLPLHPSERRQLIELLERARAREKANGGDGG